MSDSDVQTEAYQFNYRYAALIAQEAGLPHELPPKRRTIPFFEI